jgi:hypothetical protein
MKNRAVVFSAIALGLAGCGGAGQPASTQADSPSQAQDTPGASHVILLPLPPADLDRVRAQFEAANPGFTVGQSDHIVGTVRTAERTSPPRTAGFVPAQTAQAAAMAFLRRNAQQLRISQVELDSITFGETAWNVDQSAEVQAVSKQFPYSGLETIPTAVYGTLVNLTVDKNGVQFVGGGTDFIPLPRLSPVPQRSDRDAVIRDQMIGTHIFVTPNNTDSPNPVDLGPITARKIPRGALEFFRAPAPNNGFWIGLRWTYWFNQNLIFHFDVDTGERQG